jgi:hypothetical protein
MIAGPAVAGRTSFREALGAQNDGEGKPLGVLGAGLGGVRQQARIVPGDHERVAVERDRADRGVVDDLLLPQVGQRWRGLPGPQLGEAGAVVDEVPDEFAEALVGRVAGRGQAQIGDEPRFVIG